ncbi:hypothetical protein K491DRAFT_21156 [Lophiostoma macrostomum CBS 122681]|uniref:Uncharacterized protein n=1 Tax=Lophiostoma macrostomum CBS 122681 TaxID=1314788 RepID=A0A6A6T032_9PLEO|nr:hypothetical protein K491DRAFT_21156 [Lophiostoma macrostomum CBS 122681]
MTAAAFEICSVHMQGTDSTSSFTHASTGCSVCCLTYEHPYFTPRPSSENSQAGVNCILCVAFLPCVMNTHRLPLGTALGLLLFDYSPLVQHISKKKCSINVTPYLHVLIRSRSHFYISPAFTQGVSLSSVLAHFKACRPCVPKNYLDTKRPVLCFVPLIGRLWFPVHSTDPRSLDTRTSRLGLYHRSAKKKELADESNGN